MSLEENKQIARRLVEELWGKGDLAVADQFIAADVVDHNAIPGMPPGREGQKAAASFFHAAFPEIAIKVEDLVADGDRVVDRWTATMRHGGEFFGIPPTGKTVTLTGIDISRIAGGQVVETWHQEDILGLMQQLGAVPQAEQGAPRG
jgi:predicted ester cyclase